MTISAALTLIFRWWAVSSLGGTAAYHGQVADAEEYISYLIRPIIEVSRLRKGIAGNYWTARGHYYNCCSSIEALVTDEYHDVPYWTRTTLEHNGENYYLVGYKALSIEDLRVRLKSVA